MITHEKKYILFDDECYLCNGFVKRLYKLDTDKLYYFVPLHSKFGIQLIHTNNIPLNLDSVILVEESSSVVKSEAVLSILKTLGFPFRILGIVGGLLPLSMRDYIYDVIAKNRKKWFGTTATCDIPSKAFKDRFLLDIPLEPVEK